MSITSSSPSTVYTQAVSNVQSSGGYSGFSLVGSSFVANGFSTTSSSSTNLPLVLGITIPLGVIFIVVVVIVVVKVTRRTNDIREVAKVEEVAVVEPQGLGEIEEHNDTAKNFKLENKN